MKLKNETKWQTRQLISIFVRCLAEVRKHEGRQWNTTSKGFTVIVKDHHMRTNQPWVGGCASYNSKYLTMKLPPTQHATFHRNGLTTRAQCIADTFIHEVGHCLGYKHNRRGGCDTIEQGYREFILREFADETKYPVEPRIERTLLTTPRDRQQKRYEKALANQQRAQTRLKRAQTLFKKWTAKIKRYERVFATAAARPPAVRLPRVKKPIEIPTGPNVNQTGLKSLDKLGRDPRIEEITGGRGSYEMFTRPGFCFSPATHLFIGESVRDVLNEGRELGPCDCHDCIARLASEQG